MGWHGIAYASVFTVTNIFFVISIENTNVANTLIMIALAPMLSAIISFIFLKENTDQKNMDSHNYYCISSNLHF